MKKAIPILLAFLFVLPVSKVFAFGDGIMADESIVKSFSTIRNLTNSQVANLFDNNLNSYAPVSATSSSETAINFNITFNEPVDIDKMKVMKTPEHVGSLVNFRFYDVDNNIMGSRTIEDEDVKLHGVKRINVTSGATGNKVSIKIFEIEFYEASEEPPGDVLDLTADVDYNRVDLSWTLPDSDNFDHVKIYRDKKKIFETNGTNYSDIAVSPETKYEYLVTTVSTGGFESEGVSLIVNTPAEPEPEPVGEIESLTAQATHERVDLSWTLPQAENFSHVIIYRDTLKKNLFDKLLGVTTVKAATTPIFETNGTYFNDLTVQPETKYEYTLTTLSIEEIESDGVSVTVMTLAEPVPEPPVMEGGGFEKDPETGDFTYKWTSPVTGTVKIMVGGKLYKTVPAADLETVIPASDMKYTMFGKPDVQLIPVGEDGKEGKPVNPPIGGGGNDGGTGGPTFDTLPLEVSELLKTTMAVIGLLSGIVLIALAIDLVPRLIEIIKRSMAARKGAR